MSGHACMIGLAMRGRVARVLAVVGAGIASACGRVAFDLGTDGGPGGSSDAGDAGDAPDAPKAAPGCVAGETPGPFTSDFESGVPAFGTIYEMVPAKMDVFAGELRGRPGMSAGSSVYAGFEAAVADYRSRRVLVEIPLMVNTSSCAQVAVVIQDDDATQFAELAQSCNVVEAMLWVGASDTLLGSVPYDPAQHRWWQLRTDGGTLAFELSPDGVNWTTLATVATPSYFDDAYLELAAGTYMFESSPGEARFDNLYDCLR